MQSSRKRKLPETHRPPPPTQRSAPILFIEAHEADIVSGPSALRNAQSLEVEVLPSGSQRVGDALIRWNLPEDVQRTEDGESIANDASGVWVDRYDARLLLDALPSVSSSESKVDRLSPTGWSDLPSDSEDTFFLNKEETDDYRREKRRKVLADLREERLRALRAESGEAEDANDEDVWGGSDEDTDEAQKEFMRRTATHLLSSPNPAQLEMRILANHGADPRFAFLKGRWSRAWRTTKARVRADKLQAEEVKPAAVGLGGLSGYGESDEDGSNDENGEQPSDSVVQNTSVVFDAEAKDGEDAAKAARRARAKEWTEQRRTNKS
ncbi:hypothetical protein EUX98_g1443 [Antrodiella citrinella]|uniref:Uncharacterized protein n=1 Tax=Antrodiella citrinella TaxID=2447956 RepID=A0A4V3XJF1_9APHY|nr:hypothetical protein EUX98_g1443 [Antrodiella citrinella]